MSSTVKAATTLPLRATLIGCPPNVTNETRPPSSSPRPTKVARSLFCSVLRRSRELGDDVFEGRQIEGLRHKKIGASDNRRFRMLRLGRP
jgi:hypothetical protein